MLKQGKYMKTLQLIIFTVILLISCSTNDPVGPENNYKNGNTAPENSYNPTSKGTWWKYQLNTDSNGPYMICTVTDEIQIDGIFYAEILKKVDSIEFKQYFRFMNSSLYELHQFDSSGLKSNYEVLFLKTDAKIGQKWSTVTTFADSSILRYDCEIINRDFSMTVRNKLYQNVIEIKIFISIDIEGNLVPFAENYYFYTKGIGLIRTESIDAGSYDLVDYEIKK